MALAALLKSAGISMDDIARAKEQAEIVRQFIEASNTNTHAIAQRLAAIDTGLANVRDLLARSDAERAAIRGRLDSVVRTVEAIAKGQDLNDPER